MVKLRTRLQVIWTHRWAGVVLTGVSLIVAACLVLRIPSPGMSVTVMAVVAVIVSLRTKATGTEKATWMLLIVIFLMIELKAITQDRLVIAAEQIHRGQEEKKRFDELGAGMKIGFKETMNTSTGGDSYCHLEEPDPSAAILVVCPGKYPLYDLSAHVFDTDTKKPVWDKTIGGLAANTFQGFAEHLPFAVGDKQNFSVYFGARNGFWTELLHYRKVDNSWRCAKLVYRPPNQNYPEGVLLMTMIDPGFPMEELSQDSDWTWAEKRPHQDDLR